ncbi:MAG TPA: transglycosylase SLT domain-containing protein [Thermodesulfovibrionales bacterium]|nr:transglycosylase SLT domain-containing protein [Thermodesulfovibrionales bacterium]
MLEQESEKTVFSSAARLVSLSLLISLCLCVSAYASLAVNKIPSEAVTNLQKGKDLFEKRKYSEAIESFKLAYDEVPVVRDYILFFMAKTYKELDRLDDAGDCLHRILKTYPDSLLRKRVRAFEINNRIMDSSAYLTRLEGYVADYPDDAEMTFLLARTLKENGKTERSRKMFVRLYTGNSSYSDKAYRELRPSDIASDDMLAKAANLIKAFEYQKAETVLRKMISSADEGSRDELHRKLGSAFFGQKKYREAADAFLKTGDFYNGARSFLRAGDLNAFNEVASKLVSMEDSRVGPLFITYAAKKRREGSIEEALKIFRDAGTKYPSHAEEALWGIAWTYFRSGDSEAALSVLTELDNKYPNPKYRYWKQRCAGVDTPDLNTRKNGFHKDIYSLLAQLKGAEDISGRLVTKANWTPGQNQSASGNISLPADVRTALNRFAILMEIEMKDDAVAELARTANKISSYDVLLYVCRKLQEAGAYNKAVALLSRFPGSGPSEQNDTLSKSLLYPFAYWPVVSEISGRYTLDPLVLLAVMREESRFDPLARSFAGALGLMQIMPETAYNLDKKLGMNISDASAIYNIRTNIALGAYYLNALLKELGSLPAALAAYNAGRDKVKEWLKAGNYASYDEFIEDVPYDETRNYVKRVLLSYSTYLNLSSTH